MQCINDQLWVGFRAHQEIKSGKNRLSTALAAVLIIDPESAGAPTLVLLRRTGHRIEDCH